MPRKPRSLTAAGPSVEGFALSWADTELFRVPRNRHEHCNSHDDEEDTHDSQVSAVQAAEMGEPGQREVDAQRTDKSGTGRGSIDSASPTMANTKIAKATSAAVDCVMSWRVPRRPSTMNDTTPSTRPPGVRQNAARRSAPSVRLAAGMVPR